jgi:hypothetical protein
VFPYAKSLDQTDPGENWKAPRAREHVAYLGPGPDFLDRHLASRDGRPLGLTTA